MNSYYSTFPTGFSDIVRNSLKKELPDIKIDLLFHNLVTYRTELPISKIKKLKFLSDTYALIHSLKNSTDKPFSELRDWIKDSKDFAKQLNLYIPQDNTNIKLSFIENDRHIRIDQYFENNLAKLITQKTNIEISKQPEAQELNFTIRKEGYSLLGIRITSTADSKQIVQKGELPSEIAHLLNLFSEPLESDVFQNPFAGSGLVAWDRFVAFPCQTIIATDSDPEKIKKLKTKFSSTPVLVHQQNALEIHSDEAELINKIVTDPPWGVFGEKINIGMFYPQFLKNFYQLLQPGGVIVLIVAKSVDIERILTSFKKQFQIQKKIDTLVNGQPASAYKIHKVG